MPKSALLLVLSSILEIAVCHDYKEFVGKVYFLLEQIFAVFFFLINIVLVYTFG